MIIDAHSHIGHDWMMAETTVSEYIAVLMANQVDAGIVMPEPGHISPDSQQRYLLWEFDGDQIHYFSPHFQTDDIRILQSTSKIINDEVYSQIQEYRNRHETANKLFYAAMIHPIIDPVDYYSTLRGQYGCVALKLHGIAGGYSPDMIDDEHIEAIRKTELPLIIHTDYDCKKSSDLGKIRNLNSAKNWFVFLQEHNLKGYLCHGCRMDIDVLSMLAGSEDILVGIGPDYPIMANSDRLVTIPTPDYLTNICNILPREKIAFDIDYNYLEGDAGFMERMKSSLPSDYYPYVMGLNAISFFNLDL